MSDGLRLVFINHTHPNDPHVSGLRMARFAECLSTIGDRVLLITPPPRLEDGSYGQEQDIVDTPFENERSFKLRTCRPMNRPILSRARTGHLLWGVRQAVLAAHYAVHKSVFSDWTDAVIEQSNDWLSEFRPDLVFATFGNTGNWRAAQALSRKLHVPWVADTKDNYEVFVPFTMRRWAASGFADMAHMTTFSQAHKDMADRFFDVAKSVVYSGYDAIATDDRKPVAKPYELLIVGSLYAQEALERLTSGLRKWSAERETRASGKPVLKYAGGEGARFMRATENLGDNFDRIDLGYLDRNAMMRHAASSLANFYVVNPASMFQHKVFELLAAARPIITIPEENRESEDIATAAGGMLIGCESAVDIAAAIERVASDTSQDWSDVDIEEYSWMAQARVLRNVFYEAVGRTP